MIKKIIKLHNIGRFKKYDAHGAVDLKRYSVLFAENGRGKTTLCAVLRSLQANDPSLVLGRATLGSPDPPEAQILVDGVNHAFAGGAWTSPLPEIEIFDSTFVAENVFSGDAVDLGHRRKLYQVIVGQRGGELARRIEDLDAESRTRATDIRDKGTAIQVQAQLPRDVTLDSFLEMAEDPAIEEKVAAKTTELDAVRQAEQIRSRALLSTTLAPAMPGSPGDLVALLARAPENIAADAEARVMAQLAAHQMQRNGEAWLSEGLAHASETCPFCGQDLAGASALLTAYRTHFGQAYADLRSAIRQMRVTVEADLSDRKIAEFESTLDRNAAGADFWSRFTTISAPVVPAAPGDALRAVRVAAVALLDRKAAAPLEVITPGDDFAGVTASAATVTSQILTYNEQVTAANAVIAQRKAATGAASVRTVEAELARLSLVKRRHEPSVRAACDDYRSALSAKAAVETLKNAVKGELDTYTATVIGPYEATINRFLGDFHAGFTITQTRHAYPGGVATSSYQILINGTPVELGDANTPLNTPSFRNTLSSGDRSTLALAFFLARLEHHPNRTSRIVIFDDPFNSQDSFRKDHTARKIRDCGDACAQVVVLSHDPAFLGRVWERLDDRADDRKSLELKRIGLTNTSIIPWDVEDALQTAYSADRRILTGFYHDSQGDPRAVVQKIRPVLETYARRLGAGVLLEADNLGVIAGKVRTAGAMHQLFPLCDDLDELNVYTRRYMHGENTHAATEPITDGELHGYVRKTLEITGGC